MNYEKNSRIVPTSNTILGEKTFSMETFLKFQVESNWNDIDVHRHIRLDAINYTQWAKDLGTSAITLKKNIQILILSGVLKKYKASDGLFYYKICGRFDKFVLFNEHFIRGLLSIGSKNLIKTYLIYYKYTSAYGSCIMEQSEILKQLGLANSGKNKDMLRAINVALEKLGLICIEKNTSRDMGKTKTLLKIVAPKYTKTDFYKDIKKRGSKKVGFAL